MPPLANIKHEQFANAVLVNPSNTHAYKSVYKDCDDYSARTSASELLTKDNVKNRVYELMREASITPSSLISRFGKWLNDDKAPVQSWDAVKTGLRIYGIIDDDGSKTSSPVNITISII